MRPLAKGLAGVGFVALVAASVAVARRPSKPEAASHAPRAVASVDAGPRPLRGRPRVDLTTTDEDIYLGNLDGQIAELERLLRDNPDGLMLVQRLSGALHLRGRIRGSLDDLKAGIDRASQAIRIAPESGDGYLLRAEQEQSLHRFAATREDVYEAAALGADEERIAALRTELDWNAGRYDAAIAGIRAATRAHPNVSTAWLREAQLEHALGHDDDADRAFENAEDLVVDTAPLPLAHLNVQRGIQRSDQGRIDEAIVFFREAVRRMPSYVPAAEHLAEALAEIGEDEEAVELYEKIVERSSDPEFAHALAALHRKAGETARASALEARARAGYERLLVTFPEAMYWHASEFYADVGEHARARDLLRKNLELRPSSESLVALAAAELRAGNTGEARTAIERALAMPLRSSKLFDTAADVFTKLGEPERARSYRAEARKLAPAATP